MSYTVSSTITPSSIGSGGCGTNYSSYWMFSGCAVGDTVSIYYNNIVGIPIGAPIYSVYYNSYTGCSGSVASAIPAFGQAYYYDYSSMSHNPMVKCTSGVSDFSTTVYAGYITTGGSLNGGFFIATNQDNWLDTTIGYYNYSVIVTFEAPPVSGFFGAC